MKMRTPYDTGKDQAIADARHMEADAVKEQYLTLCMQLGKGASLWAATCLTHENGYRHGLAIAMNLDAGTR